MAAEKEKNSDFYGVMGLKKECTPADLRNAYKRLAMKWHPDRCSASANQKFVKEAKEKFQDIQQAYSASVHILVRCLTHEMQMLLVLSDANKRFLYDVGIYNSDDDDDENGMGEFLSEMSAMMNQNNSNQISSSSEDLQVLFEEIFQSDTDTVGSSSRSTTSPMCVSSSPLNKRNSSEMCSRKFTTESTQLRGFCIRTGGASAKRRERAAGERMPRMAGGSCRCIGPKQKISSSHDFSSRGISA